MICSLLQYFPVVSSLSFTAPNSCQDETYLQSHRLECFLYSFTVKIPDETFKESFIKLEIKDFKCSQFYLFNVSATIPKKQEIDIQVLQTAATCHGKYHVTGGISGNLRATVEQLTAAPPALTTKFQIEDIARHDINSPFRFFTKSCQTELGVSKLHFDGSISAHLIQVFDRTIKHYVRIALQENICPLLPEQVDPFVNSYLQKFNEWKQQYLPSPEFLWQESDGILNSESEPIDPSTYNIPQYLFNQIDTLLKNHWQHGWTNASYCPDPDCQQYQKGISGMLGPFGRIIGIPLHQNISLHNKDGQRLQLYLPRMEILGVGQINELQVNHLFTNNSLAITAPDAQVSLYDDSAGPDNIKLLLKEFFHLQVTVKQFGMEIAPLLQVVKWDEITVLQVIQAVESWMNTKDVISSMGCVLSSIHTMQLTDWITNVIFQDIQLTPAASSSATANLEHDVDQIITTLMSNLVIPEYTDLWTELGQGLVRGPAKTRLNAFIRKWLQQHSRTCPSASNNTTPEPWWIDFSKWKFLYQFNQVLRDNLKGINQFLYCWQLTLQHLLQSRLFDLKDVPSLYLKNFDTLTELQLLQPYSNSTEHQQLKTKVSWGMPQQLPEATMQFHVSNLDNATSVINVTLFGTIQADISTQLDYNLNDLQNVTLANLLQHVQCGILPAADLQLLPSSELLDNVIGINVTVETNNTVVQWSTLEYANYTDFVQQIVSWSAENIRTLVNNISNEFIMGSPKACPGIEISDDNDDTKDTSDPSWMQYPLVWIALFVMVGAQVVVLQIGESNKKNCNETSRNNEVEASSTSLYQPLLEEPIDLVFDQPVSTMMNTLEEEQQSDIFNDMRRLDQSLLGDIRDQLFDEQWQEDNRQQRQSQDQQQVQEESSNTTLMNAKEISEVTRFVLPMLVIGTIILLMSSNLSVGASVNLVIKLLEDESNRYIHLPGLFEFSLMNTITELYKAGIYPLLFLVVVFSGIWPYAKLLFMLHTWLKPYDSNAMHQREKRLLTLDALSKFSLVDTYVLVVFVVSFRFNLDLMSTSLGLDVYVTPEFGFYAFLLATCMSLVLGHGMLYFHRKSTKQYEREQDGFNSPIDYNDETIEMKESILDHTFCIRENGVFTQKQLSRFFQALLFTSCLVALVLLQIGYRQQSFIFEFGGLAGMLLQEEAGSGKQRFTYSLLSLGAAIPQSVEDPSNFGIIMLQMAYYFYSVVTPIICLFCLTLLLIFPMSLSRQRYVLVAAEICNAWGAVEVLLLSICAALFQISTFSSFIIGDKCDIINTVMEDLTKRGIIPGDNIVTRCFDVKAFLDPSNCLYLIAGVLLNSFVVSTGLKIAHNAVDERCNPTPTLTRRSFAEKMMNMPVIGSVAFGQIRISREDGDDDETDARTSDPDEDVAIEEEQPEWRSWF